LQPNTQTNTASHHLRRCSFPPPPPLLLLPLCLAQDGSGAITLVGLRRVLQAEGLAFSNPSLKALAVKMGMCSHKGLGEVVRFKHFLMWAHPMSPGLVALGTKLVNALFRKGRVGGGAIDLRRTFNKIDTGGVGSVTRSQFKAFVSGEGVQFSTQELEGLVNQIDTAASGRVTYSEFADFIDSLTGHISKSSDSSITM
jgi:hypothetical protein